MTTIGPVTLKLEDDELLERVKGFVPFKKYRHYKGDLYIGICIATDSEDIKSKRVIYLSTYTGEFWDRPLKMFFESVFVNDKIVRRFLPLD